LMSEFSAWQVVSQRGKEKVLQPLWIHKANPLF